MASESIVMPPIKEELLGVPREELRAALAAYVEVTKERDRLLEANQGMVRLLLAVMSEIGTEVRIQRTTLENLDFSSVRVCTEEDLRTNSVRVFLT